MLDYSICKSEFKINPTEIKLRLLAAQYHDECDSFDNKNLSIDGVDGKLPANNFERQLMVDNYRMVKDKIYRIGLKEGFSREDIRKAIRDHAKHNR